MPALAAPGEPDHTRLRAPSIAAPSGHFGIVGGGAVELLGIAIGVAAVDVGEHVRRKLDLRGVTSDLAVALAVIEVAAIAMGDRERGVVFDRRVEIVQRAVDITLAGPGIAAVV